MKSALFFNYLSEYTYITLNFDAIQNILMANSELLCKLIIMMDYNYFINFPQITIIPSKLNKTIGNLLFATYFVKLNFVKLNCFVMLNNPCLFNSNHFEAYFFNYLHDVRSSVHVVYVYKHR